MFVDVDEQMDEALPVTHYWEENGHKVVAKLVLPSYGGKMRAPYRVEDHG